MNRSTRARSAPFLRLGLGLALGIGVGSACTVESIFTCLEDQNCIDEGGEGGVCEPNSFCTFPDETCAEGKRWHDRAGEELGGNCYQSETATGTQMGSDGDSGTGGGSSSGGGSTTLPGDGSSDDGTPMTDDGPGSSSGGGGGMSCDELFGAVEAYELCEETATTCKFNVTLNQISCADLCSMYGSMMCQTAFTNDASDCASENLEVPCEELANDNICVCVK